ncbi:MAG: ABC transporter substrate-binding protein/permease [Synergistaceae bacterium]|nr:ABC transporter substrate-binding protein/permease [Synergistaceae bacterium]MBQ9896684.1 ABC transporter substrate-binding protein/permease [Synergistaceae bacterium]
MRRFILALILILALNFNAQAENIITSKAQLNAEGMKVATGEGSAAMLIIENELPKAELIYISTPQSYEEVKQGKIDACIEDRNMLELAVQNGLKGVKILDENMSETVKIAVGISRESKIKNLKDNINKFIAEIKADGTLNDMSTRWVVNKDYKMPEIKLNKNNNKLIIGTTGIYAPYSFYKGTELAGLDIELAYRFAAWLDADIEFKVYDFAGLVTAAVTGKIDLAMSNLNITRERAEVIDFSDALFEMPVGILVKADNNIANTEPELKTFKAEAEAENTLWDEIKASFNKTFIREGRYRLFIDGVLITLLITCLACIFGTALGFVIFLICRKHEYKLVQLFLGFIQGTPMVVLLMILYYIIFGKLAISGVFTAVIAFTLTVSAGVYGLLKIGVGAVDKGQYEAAYALGYSELKTFFKIILPQALPHVFNAYCGEIITMLKGTAIVGYIAVMDLTKIGDVIRARTYEPFFPLIAITLIYFVLEFVIFIIIKYLQNKLDYKNRTPEEILGFGLEVISHD